MLTLANLDTYDGQWDDDLKHGEGSYFYEQKQKRYDGVWERGKCCGGGFEDRVGGRGGGLWRA